MTIAFACVIEDRFHFQAFNHRFERQDNIDVPLRYQALMPRNGAAVSRRLWAGWDSRRARATTQPGSQAAGSASPLPALAGSPRLLLADFSAISTRRGARRLDLLEELHRNGADRHGDARSRTGGAAQRGAHR